MSGCNYNGVFNKVIKSSKNGTILFLLDYPWLGILSPPERIDINFVGKSNVCDKQVLRLERRQSKVFN